MPGPAAGGLRSRAVSAQPRAAAHRRTWIAPGHKVLRKHNTTIDFPKQLHHHPCSLAPKPHHVSPACFMGNMAMVPDARSDDGDRDAFPV